MPKRSPYEDDYEYDDEELGDDHKGPRKFKKDEPRVNKKKKWDRESSFDRNNDHDERR